MNRVILFLILVSVNTAFAQTSLNSVESSAIDSIFQSYCNPGEPGMAMGIVKDGEVVYKATRGKADLSNNLSITDSTAFNIASVSKQFTAYLMLIAEKEGKLKLSDDIRKYLPELKHLPNKITVEQLANHSHGLPNYSDLIEMIGFRLSSPISNDQAVPTILSVKHANFEAGTQYQYGNSGFMLLAEILKRIYKKPFPILIDERVFQPLNMMQTSVIDHPNTIVKNKALPYKWNGDSFEQNPIRQTEIGSTGIYTTLNDMIKWATHFQNPSVGNEDQIGQLSRNTIAITKTGDLEYGLGLYTETYKGIKTVFHGGGAAGYRAYILHVPEETFSIVILGNQENTDALYVIYDILDFFFKEQFEETAFDNTSYTETKLKGYEGTYRFQPGQYWTFRADGTDLYFDGVDQPLPLVGEDKFKFFLPHSFLTFHADFMEFRITDMNYRCEKIDVDPPALDKEQLEKYVGIYKNMEFNTFYEVVLIENQLFAKHLTNGEIPLNPLSENIFYADYPLGELNFKLDPREKVSSFTLSGQNFKNVEFLKVH